MLASAAMKLLLGASSFFSLQQMPWPLLQAAIVEADCFDVTLCHGANLICLLETTHKVCVCHPQELTQELNNI